MEKQTKHRILGILVVIGLVVILLPLFQGEKNLTTEAALDKAPPFPDQSVQVAANFTEPTAPQATLSPQPLMVDSSMASVVKADGDTAQIPLPRNTFAKAELADQTSSSTDGTVSKPEVLKTSNFRIIEGDNVDAIIIKNKHASRRIRTIRAVAENDLVLPKKKPLNVNKAVPIQPAANESSGLSQLNSAAWVIQLGSYKNKALALRVVNQLRANGYRAFIQEIASSFDENNTQVYVGPENKPTTARALALRLKSEMHMQGIVISYKPLDL